MNLSISTIIKISRPRFWLYLAGPFVVGFAAGAPSVSSFSSSTFFLYLLYFLVPCNLFLYGVNDLADEDTDQYNNKKNEYEFRLKNEQRSHLKALVIICFLITISIIFINQNIFQSLQLLFLLFLSYAYSCFPFRWKAKPFIDSVSNILYIVPGIFGYYLMSGELPAVQFIVAGATWSAAMHLFSAIPDIKADSKANLKTTAVLLGQKNSLYLCSLLWLLSSALVIWYTHSIALLVLSVYSVIPLICIIKKLSLEKVYKVFPYINAFIGFYLFWYSIILRFF